MVAAGYRHLARQLELSDLLVKADEVKETTRTPGWEFLVASVAEHESRMTAQLLNGSTAPEEVTRLRGLIAGLRCISEAAESIIQLAEEREQDAIRQAGAAA
jgi:hypothetical protein